MTPANEQQAPATIDTLAAFASAVACAADRAIRQSKQPQSQTYAIGGYHIKLCFTTAAVMAAWAPALTHLAVAPTTAPDFTITLWESATSGVDLPPFPPAIRHALGPNALSGIQSHSERYSLFFPGQYPVFNLLDRARNQAYCWIPSLEQLPMMEGAAPCLLPFHWWLSARGGQIVHGAAVGTEAGGALVVGRSGAGKSTTALTCLQAGLAYLGDDYCLVDDQPNPTLYSLYNSGKIHFTDLAHFSTLAKASTRYVYQDLEKNLYFFAESFSNQVKSALPLRAILVPRLTSATKTRYIKGTAAAALLAVGPSSALQLLGSQAQTFKQLTQLVRRLPCFLLELGRDRTTIPAAITELLHALS
ncbi:MAG: hypothetical protein KF832_04225 [Caldilineaceae bacterium]|nr:hypothetical protein [Caldilineaceae bacterium]